MTTEAKEWQQTYEQETLLNTIKMGRSAWLEKWSSWYQE